MENLRKTVSQFVDYEKTEPKTSKTYGCVFQLVCLSNGVPSWTPEVRIFCIAHSSLVILDKKPMA